MRQMLQKIRWWIAVLAILGTSQITFGNSITADCDGFSVFSDELHPNCQGGVTYVYVEATLSKQNDAGDFEEYLTAVACTIIEAGESAYSADGLWGADLPEGTYSVTAMTNFYSTNGDATEEYLRDLADNGCQNPQDVPLDGSIPNRCATSTPPEIDPFNCDDPPPPPTGGEGCTPGYWKQPHHFFAWTSPYTPETLFSDVFEDAFPGMTLLEVVSLKGNKGKIEALGRHTVAALLNAASGEVSYGMTVADVVGSFNDVFPEDSGSYESLKNHLEALNESGCPLGNDGNNGDNNESRGGRGGRGGALAESTFDGFTSIPSLSFRRGDASNDGRTDITDSVLTLQFVFLGQGRILCLDAADANDDGRVDITDSVTSLTSMFLGTVEIPAPGRMYCGIDPTEDTLTCEASSCF